MKRRSTKNIIAVVSVLTLGALNAAAIKAETTEGANALMYNNSAYIHAIQDSPNPVADRKVENAEIVYVSKGSGPAIYSYPTNVSHQVTAFNVEYVETAYGPAIYSYPNNNVTHRLELSDNQRSQDKHYIAPVSLSRGYVPDKVTDSIQ
ncbi:MAG: hypothetical protein ACXWT1_20235 [Methylobacter sp.]